MRFTPCKAEKPLKSTKLQEKVKEIYIIGQTNTFYRQKIPDLSCTNKETVDIDILLTGRNGDTKIMQSITSGPVKKMKKWKQLSQFRSTSTI